MLNPLTVNFLLFSRTFLSAQADLISSIVIFAYSEDDTRIKQLDVWFGSICVVIVLAFHRVPALATFCVDLSTLQPSRNGKHSRVRSEYIERARRYAHDLPRAKHTHILSSSFFRSVSLYQWSFHGTRSLEISSGPQCSRSSAMSGHDSGYGEVRKNGFRPFRLFCSTSEWHPYGSDSNGLAAFWASPRAASSGSNPDEVGGSTPMYRRRWVGHCSAPACICSNLWRLNEKEIIVTDSGYDPVTSWNRHRENMLHVMYP